ncbi:MAG TPA: hypothetical protein EYM41_04080, partial [Dehalococcoidia bacterium]|nr:hypothetical protein [Dehalococcoidia bacterium]
MHALLVHRVKGTRHVLLAVGVGLASLAIVACGSDEPVGEDLSSSGSVPNVSSGSTGIEPAEPGWTAISEEINLVLATPDLGVGMQRFGIVLSDDTGLIKFPIVRLTSNFFPNGYDSEPDASLTESASARFYIFPFGTRG